MDIVQYAFAAGDGLGIANGGTLMATVKLQGCL